jgi:dienelactone hydrolase
LNGKIQDIYSSKNFLKSVLFNSSVNKLNTHKMKNNFYARAILICMIIMGYSSIARSASVAPKIKEVNVSVIVGGVSYKAYIAYDDNVKGKRPAVLVIPEWWGLNDYPKMRARKLAELGYVAMALDVYGNGKVAADPTEAQQLTAPFYKDPALAGARLDQAFKVLKALPQTDPENVAAIGYCFGGGIVLNYAKLGADLKGVVSFHGGVSGGAPVDKNLLKAKILICQGGSDKFVTQKDVDIFKNKLDSIGADNTLKVYPNATHAFTNPDATATGKKFNMPIEYNPEADKNSWDDMKMFFAKIFNK